MSFNMSDFNLEEIKNKCKAKHKFKEFTLKDIKVIYFLYNDPDISRKKIEIELKRSTTTVQKINNFIVEYFKNFSDEKPNDELFQRIADKINKGELL